MICARCKHDLDVSEFTGKNKTCNICLLKQKLLRGRYQGEGRCKICGCDIVGDNLHCAWCLTKAIESSNKVPYGTIDSLMLKQNGRCAITGVKLFVGKNLSIDHIIPRSQFNSLEEASNMNNIRLVTKMANSLLGTYSDDELIEFCKAVIMTAGLKIIK